MTVLVLSILVVLGYAFSYSAGVYGSTARNARDALRRECAAESALNQARAMLCAHGGAGRLRFARPALGGGAISLFRSERKTCASTSWTRTAS